MITTMAEYMILICEDESAYATATPDVLQQVMEAHNRFSEQVAETGGKIIEGRALQPTSTATSIRGDGRPVRRNQGSDRRLLPGRGA
jgi:hypothetical protein